MTSYTLIVCYLWVFVGFYRVFYAQIMRRNLAGITEINTFAVEIMKKKDVQNIFLVRY